MNQKKFQVSRVSRTKGTVQVGIYDTLDKAEDAAYVHFRDLPKRGNFSYVIDEVELEVIGGVEMLVHGVNSQRKIYSKEELMEIYRQEWE